MPIDFFEFPCNRKNANCKKVNINCKTVTRASIFGLCDHNADEKLPAFLDFKNEQNWTGVVINNQKKELTFKAVDFCVDILRDNEELIKRCEGFLIDENKIIFIELKDRGYSGWLKDAREKFTETIKYL